MKPLDALFQSGFITKLTAKMKRNKKLELAIYAALLALGVLICSLGSCSNKNSVQGNTDSGAYGEGTEHRLEEALGSIDGVGRVRTMIERDADGQVLGVIVIADGAEDIALRVRLQNAVCTVLNIPPERVEVFKMQSYEAEG